MGYHNGATIIITPPALPNQSRRRVRVMNRKEAALVIALLSTTFLTGVLSSRFVFPPQTRVHPITFLFSSRNVTYYPDHIWFLWNFTVDLSNRDAGSTLVTFKTAGVPANGLYLFKSLEVVLNVTYSPIKAETVIPNLGVGSWRPVSSGAYSLVAVWFNSESGAARPSVSEVTAIETWTTSSVFFQAPVQYRLG